MGQKRSVIGREWRILISAVLLASTLVAAASGQTKARPQLYLVAIDDVPLEMMNRLVSHFHTKFEITIQMLPPVALDRLTFDPERVQLVADKLIQAVRHRYPELAKDPRARVIAITRLDMFMEALRNEWRFTFSLRSRDRRALQPTFA